MLVRFPTNVHKFLSAKEIPRYGRSSEKWSKTSKIRKLNSLGHQSAQIFKNSKNQPLVIGNTQNHKLNNNWSIRYVKNGINWFFINVSYEINGSFLMEFRQKDPIFHRLKNFQRLEAVAMLVCFPTNVHELLSAKQSPRYGRFSEKGSKTSKIRKLTR